MKFEYSERNYEKHLAIAIKWTNEKGEVKLRHAVMSNKSVDGDILRDKLYNHTVQYLNLEKDSIRWRWYFLRAWEFLITKIYYNPKFFIRQQFDKIQEVIS